MHLRRRRSASPVCCKHPRARRRGRRAVTCGENVARALATQAGPLGRPLTAVSRPRAVPFPRPTGAPPPGRAIYLPRDPARAAALRVDAPREGCQTQRSRGSNRSNLCGGVRGPHGRSRSPPAFTRGDLMFRIVTVHKIAQHFDLPTIFGEPHPLQSRAPTLLAARYSLRAPGSATTRTRGALRRHRRSRCPRTHRWLARSSRPGSARL